MPLYSNNNYLESMLENLVASYETEVNYTPVPVVLDPKQIAAEDIEVLKRFVTDTRKRLFIFKIPGNESSSLQLEFIARKSILDTTAKIALESTSNEPEINPLKYALAAKTPIRAGIQIQKSFLIKTPVLEKEIRKEDTIKTQIQSGQKTVMVRVAEYPELQEQLNALGITHWEPTAAKKIKKYPGIFKNGIILKNLPAGFYINQDNALCFTKNPSRLPTALAPKLEILNPLILPSQEALAGLIPPTVDPLLFSLNYSTIQQNALIKALDGYEKDIQSFFKLYKESNNSVILTKPELSLVVPFLCKQYILGGEAHAALLTRLLHRAIIKKIPLEFLENPAVQQALLSTQGIKNLQKLVKLPPEQRQWWNTLVSLHRQYDDSSFDFNACFEAYTQIFLPAIAEKNLVLPTPCPIDHPGHFLITLNRVLDVIEHAENPDEQCASLSNLNWGPGGVHHAMIHQSGPEQFKQVASCMEIAQYSDTHTNPQDIYAHLEEEDFQLKPWLFRYIGQHWKKNISTSDIQAQLHQIEQQTWPLVQKNQLIFILTYTFAEQTPFDAAHWNATLAECITTLNTMDDTDRVILLQLLSGSFTFKPMLSLAEIQSLITLASELKQTFPTRDFKDDVLVPLLDCVKTDGLPLLQTIKERVKKITKSSGHDQTAIPIIASFTAALQKNRAILTPKIILLLAKLNEQELTQAKINGLLTAFKNLHDTKGAAYHNLVVDVLSQINLAKSQTLPTIANIEQLLNTLSTHQSPVPALCNTMEKQECWLKEIIAEGNMLPGCVLGIGDISKLDNLIVDAFVDAIKNRGDIFNDIPILKKSLRGHLQNPNIPQELRDQLEVTLFPFFETIEELVLLLQRPNPQFSDIIQKLHLYVIAKPLLLNATYGLFGVEIKGEHILSFLLTGQKSASDTNEGVRYGLFATLLTLLFDRNFVPGIINYFNKPVTKALVKDVDADICFHWMKQFNDTHSLMFFFKDELIYKKVVPILKKTLQQLNIQDKAFEAHVLKEAEYISESIPDDQSLQQYKDKIQGIGEYINLLIDIKDRLPGEFNTLFQQFNTGALARLNYHQKYILANKLIQNKPADLNQYLKLTTEALEEYVSADEMAIERAIQGIEILFSMNNLESETQVLFFKMSMAHNLKSTTPFPMAALSALMNAPLPAATKSILIKQIIFLIGRLSGDDLVQPINKLVNETQTFLNAYPDKAMLCLSLLKRIALENSLKDIDKYPKILKKLNDSQNREKIATILTYLANNTRDVAQNLSVLSEICDQLEERSVKDVDSVLALFDMPPSPTAQKLNAALLDPETSALARFCSNFDLDPFGKGLKEKELKERFATNRIKDAILQLEDLLHGEQIPHALQIKWAKQLTYIETLGYTDPLNPDDFTTLKKLTAKSRADLRKDAVILLKQLRDRTIAPEELEVKQLELLAYMRAIYERSTGIFPNTTQMLICLLALEDTASNLLMRIKTGEGKSINAPMLAVLEWIQGGTVIQFTANPTLLARDYKKSCEPFFDFLSIPSAKIQHDSTPEEFVQNGINCSTVEDMAFYVLRLKELSRFDVIMNGALIHMVLDECDDALLDQTLLYKLIAEDDTKDNHAAWIYPLAYQFINLPAFRNIDKKAGDVWIIEEDIEQFRQFLNKQINETFQGDAEKQNYILKATNTQLTQWIHASCVAASQTQDKEFVVQPIKEKDDFGNEITKKIVCVPLIRSTPKAGSIFTDGVQEAAQARLKAENPQLAHSINIDNDPLVLASMSALGLIKTFLGTNGRLVGISATPGDTMELEGLASALGTQAIGVAPHAGEFRKVHDPIFIFKKEHIVPAVHKTIESIKLPITERIMSLDKNKTPKVFQTYEESAKHLADTEKATELWGLTQTQPILIINEDFESAKTVSDSLEVYREQGFEIQTVTGKETPEELDKMIKRAGDANTITVGTAMLAKGIDINIGDHPKGLFVIQTYTTTDRMQTQIAGRSARNGKPGEWLPIYQAKPPAHWFYKLLYYIFPFYKRRVDERSINEFKREIKMQEAVTRLYMQEIDAIDRVLMKQIEDWEALLIALYPDDPKLRHTLYQWRENILSELARSIELNPTQETSPALIAQYKKLACKLWEGLREEQWLLKAQQAPTMTLKDELQFNYLKHLNLSDEFKVQSALQKKTKPFIAGTQALMHQNLDMIIRDKAGAFMAYNHSDESEEKNLILAQSRQILPLLLAEFCSIYPDAFNTLIPKKTTQRFYLPEIINQLIDRIIQQTKRIGPAEKEQYRESMLQFYQEELKTADTSKIEQLLLQVKRLLIDEAGNLPKISLPEQFKLQGLMQRFATFYDNSSLPPDPHLIKVKNNHTDDMMRNLAQFLMSEFSWVKNNALSIWALFERESSKDAAHEIYDLASKLLNAPQDKNTIQDLYTALMKHKLILKDKYLFSIGHSNPRHVIHDALAAIDSLENIPCCDNTFRDACHDTVLAEHHLKAFRDHLAHTSPYYFESVDATWNHLKNTLLKISHQANQGHIVLELHEAINRFMTYEAYLPYMKQLTSLNKQLLYSLEELEKKDGLKKNIEESLFETKSRQLADLLQVNPDTMRIHTGTDGIQSYIEMQIADAPLKNGFSGYQSTFFPKIEAGKSRLQEKINQFEKNKATLKDLTNKEAKNFLSEKNLVKFLRLQKLKELLPLDWHKDPKVLNHPELPSAIKNKLLLAEKLNRFDCRQPLQDLAEIQKDLAGSMDARLTELFTTLLQTTKEFEEIHQKAVGIETVLHELKKPIQPEIAHIEQLEKEQKNALDKWDFFQYGKFSAQILFNEGYKNYISGRKVAAPQKTFDAIKNEELLSSEKLTRQIQEIEQYKMQLAIQLQTEAKKELVAHIELKSQKQVDILAKELKKTRDSINTIEETEKQKSRYQTRRFFKTSEVLEFEARLLREKEAIHAASGAEELHEDRVEGSSKPILT